MLGIGAVTGALLVFPAVLAWGFTHPPRRRHRGTPRTVLGLAYERVRFHTTDGLTLAGWLVPHPSPRGVVIVSHGYFGNRGTMLPYLRFLHDGGYSVVLYDFRAHGWSGGRRTTFGVGEIHDLRAAVRFVQSHPALAALPCALLGESMGAAVSLLVGADAPLVAAVVADSAYARFDSAVVGRLRLLFGERLGAWVAPHAERMGTRLLGVPCAQIAPVEALPRYGDRPVLLIHGTADRLVRLENFDALRGAAPWAQAWSVDGVQHVRSVYDASDYAARVLAFLDAALTAEDRLPGS
jgi:fermentation-respiration switch protein FrsA (DUF1100 family)